MQTSEPALTQTLDDVICQTTIKYVVCFWPKLHYKTHLCSFWVKETKIETETSVNIETVALRPQYTHTLMRESRDKFADINTLTVDQERIKCKEIGIHLKKTKRAKISPQPLNI